MSIAEWVAAIERGDKGYYEPPPDIIKQVWAELLRRDDERKQIEKKNGR